MIWTILAAGGGILFGASGAALWHRPRRDAAGRFTQRMIDLDAIRSTLRRLGAILTYISAGFVLAFAIMLWGAK